MKQKVFKRAAAHDDLVGHFVYLVERVGGEGQDVEGLDGYTRSAEE